jgi:hypothetical protein
LQQLMDGQRLAAGGAEEVGRGEFVLREEAFGLEGVALCGCFRKTLRVSENPQGLGLDPNSQVFERIADAGVDVAVLAV